MTAKPGGRVDAVLVCGGRWHDFDLARRELLNELGRYDRVKTAVFADYGCEQAIAGADLLVTYTCDVRPTDAQQQLLESFVASGGRWLALHGTNSALDPPERPGAPFRAPRAFPRLASLLGSQFLGHPPIAPYRVEVTEPRHPLVAGIKPFEVSDELYCCALEGPLQLLLHTRFVGTCDGFADREWPDDDARPVLYLKPVGLGTVCYFTLGHCRGPVDMQDLMPVYPRVERGSWGVAEYRTILRRCVDWGIAGSFVLEEAS